MRTIIISILCVFLTISILSGCADQDKSRKSVEDYKAEARSAVVSYKVDQAIKLMDDASVTFVDLREADEITAEGKIPGAVHVPRGVLEFYIDPTSSLHMDIFSPGRTLVFYCATGGRSLLAAKVAMDMGLSNTILLEGGFSAWVEAGGAIDPPTEKK